MNMLLKKTYHKLYKYITGFIIIVGALFIVLYAAGFRTFCVQSGSMGNAVPVGSLCFVNIYSGYSRVAPGEIIAFSVGENMKVTHRAVQVDSDGITTKGDSNEIVDSQKVTEDNYIGQTMFFIPYAGYIMDHLHTKKGVIIITVIMICLFIAGIIYRKTS